MLYAEWQAVFIDSPAPSAKEKKLYSGNELAEVITRLMKDDVNQ